MHFRLSASILVGALICAIALFAMPAFAASGSLTPQNAGPSASDEIEPTYRAATFPRSVAWWPYSTGPFYGHTQRWAERAPNVLRLPVGSFEIGAGLPIPERLSASLQGIQRGGKQHFLVQLRPSAMDLPFRDVIESLGAEVVGSLPVSGLMLRMNKGAYDRIVGSPLVQFVEPFHPAYKIHPTVGHMPQATAEEAASPLFRLELVLFRGEPLQPTLDALAQLGLTVEHSDKPGSFGTVWVTAHAAAIPEIARLESVRLIKERGPQMLDNIGAKIQQSDVNTFNGLHYWKAGIDGDGQLIAVTDTGFSADAGDFSHTRADSGWVADGIGRLNGCAQMLDDTVDADGKNVDHRKIACYTRSNLFGGSGDYSACDNSAPLPGIPATHGQVVAGTAGGNATRGVVPLPDGVDLASPTDSTDSTYCEPFTDAACTTPIVYGQGFWDDGDTGGLEFTESDVAYDGVAKGARFVFVDSDPVCPDSIGISPGAAASRINSLFTTFKAHIQNESFGTIGAPGSDPTYPDAYDGAIWDHAQIFLATSAGNEEAVPNYEACSEQVGSLGSEASGKNVMSVGAANGLTTLLTFTSVGPALSNAGAGGVNDGQARIAPRVLAQGIDEACRSFESGGENQTGPATCANQSASGTSFAAPNIAGVAALIGEYLEEGFHPDGTNENATNNSDKVAKHSSALTQAIMLASTNPQFGYGNENEDGRANTAWGYGQVFLNNVLPLANDPATVSGLLLHSLEDLDRTDGTVLLEGLTNLSGIQGSYTGNQSSSHVFEVLNDNEDLRVAMVWYEPETIGAALGNDLDLEVRYCGANGTCGDGDDLSWQGNAFHEDNDQNCADRNTPGNWDLNGDGSRDAYFYTISDQAILNGQNPPNNVLANYKDNANNTEAVFIPRVGNQPGALDVDGDADGSGDWPTVTTGTWQVTVTCNACPDDISPAIAIAGPVAAGSSVRFDKNPATCNTELVVTVSENVDGADPVCPNGCTEAEISNRTTLEVLDASGTPTGDTLSGINFNVVPGTTLRFESDPIPLSLTAGVNSSDGILAVDHLYSVRATYNDNVGSVDPRVSTTRIDCAPDVEVGLSSQIGLDSQFLLIGGCDEDPYFDQGETFSLSVNFFNTDPADLIDAVVSLLACQPGTFDAPTGTCTADTNLTIHNNDTVLGLLPSFTTQLTRFAISTNGTPAGRTEVDLAFCLSGAKLGQQVRSCSINRVLLQADDEVQLYSTDCPTGCTVNYDRNFDEKYDNFIPNNDFDPLNFVRAGLDESAIVYGNMTSTTGACGTGTDGAPATCGNPGFNGLWNWDGGNDEGFRTGVSNQSVDVNTLTPNSNFGEDENFDGVFQAGEDKSDGATTGGLDQNWGTGGGCGYMTASGCWHTGTIGTGSTPGTACRGNDSICEQYDKEDGTDGLEYWFEMLRTPIVHPVNFGPDADTFDWRSQIMAWEWNMQADVGEDEAWLWEFDIDVDSRGNIELGDDLFPGILLADIYFGFGLGAISGGQLNIIEGAPVFADTCDAVGSTCNGAAYGDEYVGSIGGNRVGLRGCYFEDLNLLTAGGSDPDGDGSIEFTHAEFVTNTPKPLDDDCDNEVGFGPDGCPGTCGIDDDGNGIIDDLAEACPCFTCTAGPRQGMGCSDHPYCNPSGDPTTGDNRCLLDVDTYTANPSANTAFSDKLPTSAGTPRAYGDDACGDGNADEGVFASFDPVATGERQTRNYGAESGNFGQIEFTTLEDLFGPAGDSWQAEIGFVSFEPAGDPGDPSYGLGIDDMVLEWRELHPINQTSDTCAVQVGTNGPGQCASIGMGATSNTFEGDGAIPVTVIDPNTAGNLGEAPCAANQVRIEAFSEAERTPTSYCLTDDGTGKAFSGFIKTTTQIRNTADDLVYVAFNFADTPSITARYFDLNDGVNSVTNGPDGQPGIAGFDDDGDGATDEADERCPKDNVLGTGRSPHVAGQPARFSDDTCGCPDNPITDVTLSTFNAVDLLITKVTATDSTGDNDGYADGGETVNIDITIRNLSDVDLEDVTLKLTSNSPTVGCLLDDEVNIDLLLRNDDAIGGPDEVSTATLGDDFSFIAQTGALRTDTAQDLTSTFTLSMQALVPANEQLGILEDIPIQGLFTIRELEITHNLDSGTPGTQTSVTEDFESIKCTDTVQTCQGGGDTFLICNNTGPGGSCTASFMEFHALSTGDDTAELDGTRCQYNDPANPFGNNTDPNDSCELGEGFDNTDTFVHLHSPQGSNCNGINCPDPAKSHGAGDSSLHIGYHPAPGECPLCDQDAAFLDDDGTTMKLNRMRWAETANNFQLGPGAGQNGFTVDPSLSYWTQMSISDGGLFGATRGTFAWDAHRVYVCVDDNDNNHCDSTEAGNGGAGTGTEVWEPISASLNPETNARVAAFINCGYEPSDDGNNEDDFFLNSLDVGPSSTCFGTVVDTCFGRTRADNTVNVGTFGTLVSLSTICYPETGEIDGIVPGVYEDAATGGGAGAGIWAKREYDLQKFKGRKVIFRWHLAQTGLEGIDFVGSALGAQGGNRDDGIFVDDIQIAGVSSTDYAVIVDNTNPGSSVCQAGQECGTVTTRVAALPYPRNRADGSRRPALACSDTSVAFCDYDRNSISDTTNTSASLNAPGRPVLLLADESSADKCLGGALEYRWETSGGMLIRDWLTRPDLLVNPAEDTTYVVKVRCSTDVTCTSQASMLVDVPEGVVSCRTLNLLFNQGNKTQFSWQAPAGAGCPTTYDAAKGTLSALIAASGSFSGATCLENDGTDLLATDAAVPAAGDGLYYLTRAGADSYDNETGEPPAVTRNVTACP